MTMTVEAVLAGMVGGCGGAEMGRRRHGAAGTAGSGLARHALRRIHEAE